MPSTFSSPVVGSAYLYKRGTPRTVCRSTGYSLLTMVQTTVVELLTDVGALPSAGGSSISVDQVGVVGTGGDLSSGPGWDDATLRGLYAFVQYSAQQSSGHRAVIQGYLSDIAADILRRSGHLSRRTMTVAMWVAVSRDYDAAGNRTYGVVSPDVISFDDDTVFPTYGEIPPVPANRTLQFGLGSCASIAEGARANDPITTTAVFGVDVGLLLLVLAAGVIGIASATAARKNPTDSDAVEWSRRRDIPYVEAHHMNGKRYSTTELTLRGKALGSKTQILSRGKVVSTTYFLPPLVWA